MISMDYVTIIKVIAKALPLISSLLAIIREAMPEHAADHPATKVLNTLEKHLKEANTEINGHADAIHNEAHGSHK